MIIDRIFTSGLAQVAYLVADEAARKVAVIDPRRDIDAYITWTAQHRFEIVAIVETHVHADFVSGARELASATGAPIYASRLSAQGFPHWPLDDGDEIPIGTVNLRALWTPGHTPEHMSFLATDPGQGDVPVAIFSGDALFVGEVGRPDLLGEEETQRLAEQLYETVTDRFSPLDDAVVVYPGHTAGSACGKKIGTAPHTTIGQEKLFNYAFQLDSRDAFIETVLAGMPKSPTYYPVLKRVNKVGPALLSALAPGDVLTADDVAARQAAGALVVDARSPEAFGAGHVPNAVFAGLGPNFTTWMGWLAPYDHELILVLDEQEGAAQFEQARTALRRIGLDRVAGYLDGGMVAWQAEDREVVTLPQMSVYDLADWLVAPQDGLTVLDVRTDDEWTDGRVAGAAHRYAGEILQGAELPVDGASQVAVVCGSGYRSSVVSSLLQARGHQNLINVTGGMGAWHEAKLPTRQDGK